MARDAIDVGLVVLARPSGEAIHGIDDQRVESHVRELAQRQVGVLDDVVEERGNLSTKRGDAQHDPHGMEDERLGCRGGVQLPAMRRERHGESILQGRTHPAILAGVRRLVPEQGFEP